MKIKSIAIVLSLVAIAFISCEKDNDDKPLVENGKILVSTMLPNPDGWSGSTYMQLMANMEPKALTNATALPLSYSSVPIVCGNDVYALPGWGGETDILTKYSRIDGELVEQGECPLPEQSWATNVVTKGNSAYISCPGNGKILVLNHQTMELITEIDLSSYGAGDQNPDPSSMLIRDNLLFVGLIQMVGGYYPAPERPYSDILIINTDDNEIVKMITQSTAGISYPTRAIDPFSIFMDENNDIYIVGLGCFGAMHNSGVLRIKAGETEFDDSYQFIFNTTAIEGESNPTDYMHAVNYYGNGKMYATADIPAYYSDPMNYIEDRAVVPVEIDLNARTIKALGFPRSNAFGVSVGIFEDQVVFGLATESSNGFFTYNPSTGTTSTSAVITTEGYPYSFVAFED
ncbi:hypothetical protein [Maribellus maritimus]|uniref:hypothetical protein n=1 Tax=Maribellus maritimus TaxID=2870838 RepID=UPI001EEA2D65|nr:hypothetical protein [Maribellus maritimus]MCG6190273.1 hypothetical protein [Maribellus maritimus]